ncbi:UvrD-helicase domain-containing protein [candidate division CSSED10-310 bacterium]|uniref:UvrD-helicase domain-containing protein n=1 Tax=candidate division CSSED10-310 bacterium TaxID=2855610 RepID=A0ABV6YR94_UNCC1
MATVLINDVVKKYILSQSVKTRTRIRTKFEYLESGIWDTGLKVKKLKGVVERCLFEGRLDRGNRILFTLGRDSDGREVYIYIWGIVEHDAVSRKSRTIFPDNASFLNFQTLQETTRHEIEFNDFEKQFFTQECITERLAPDSGTVRWYNIEHDEWKRIKNYKNKEFELLLHLTPEQRNVLTQPPPILLSGTAGSGKTTLGIYHLLREELYDKRVLYITYNRFLKNFAERYYYGLINSHEFSALMEPPLFVTYKTFCLNLATRYKLGFDSEQEVDFHLFDRIYTGQARSGKYDSALVWEEIRSIIKGALPQVNVQVFNAAAQSIQRTGGLDASLTGKLQRQLHHLSLLGSAERIEKLSRKHLQLPLAELAANIEHTVSKYPERCEQFLLSTVQMMRKKQRIMEMPHLSLFDYELMGRKKAPNFRYDRTEIYKIFEWYHQWLDKENLWDELDLVREVGKLYAERAMTEHIFDFVVCDEVQDFTDLQHDLLFSIVNHPTNIFCAGDTRQIVNPSGFRWSELKRHFYDRKMTVPDVHYLRLNFRCSGAIIELSNTLLELKRQFLGTSAAEQREYWKYKGRPAVIIDRLSEQEILLQLSHLGARQVVITRDQEECDRLKKALHTELIFSIKEAKGLEFNTVILWKFCADHVSRDLWQVILNVSKETRHEARIKHELNLLYVGITRAQNDLLIYDGPASSVIWRSDHFKDKIMTVHYREDIDRFLASVSTPEDWIDQGNYYLERNYYKAAMECFKNGGDFVRMALAQGYEAAKAGDHGLAGDCFEKAGEFEQAALHHEKARKYDQALALWQTLKRKDRVERCAAFALEQKGNFDKAGPAFVKLGIYDRAAQCYLKSQQYLEAAELLLKKLDQPEQAAAYYHQAGRYKKAALLYKKVGDFKNAAENYTRAGMWSAAEKAWLQTGKMGPLKEFYSQTEQTDKLMKLFEKTGDVDGAVRYFKNKDFETDLSAEAKALLKTKQYFPALARFKAVDDYSGLGDTSAALKDYEGAAGYYNRAGDRYRAAEMYLKLNRHRQALCAFLSSEKDRISGYRRSIEIMDSFQDDLILEDIAKSLQKQKNYSSAAVIYQNLELWSDAGMCFALDGDAKLAFEAWDTDCDEERLWDIETFIYNTRNQKIATQFLVEHFTLFTTSSSYMADRYRTLVTAFDDLGIEKIGAGVYRNYLKHLAKLDRESGCFFDYLYEKLLPHNMFNDFFTYCDSLGSFVRKNNQKGNMKLRANLQLFRKNQEWDALAATYAVLRRKDPLKNVLEKLQLDKNNYLLFMHSRRYGEAVDFCLEHNQLDDALTILMNNNAWERAAALFEQTNRLDKAAGCYLRTGNWKKAAPLFEKTKEYYMAGCCYEALHEYHKALHMFQLIPGATRKIKAVKQKIARRDSGTGAPKKRKKRPSKPTQLSLFELFDPTDD